MAWQARIAALIGLMALAETAQAQQAAVQPVRFPPGATGTVIKGRITGDQSISYTVGAEAGQTMTVKLTTGSGYLSFNLYAPGKGPGDEALAIGEMLPQTNRFEGPLPTSGVYTISVFLNRAAARRNQSARYTLAIDIPGSARAGTAPVRGDFADGLQGGPDSWVVTGVPEGDVLQLRSGPSTRRARLAALPNGTILRNRGCRMVSGQRWCKVETTAGAPVNGWVAGRFLAEGPGLPAASASGDLASQCVRFAAVDFATKPANIRTGGIRKGPEGPLVDATANLGRQGVKPFACRFDASGRYLGILSLVDEGRL